MFSSLLRLLQLRQRQRKFKSRSAREDFFHNRPYDIRQAEVAALEAIDSFWWSKPSRCSMVACRSWCEPCHAQRESKFVRFAQDHSWFHAAASQDIT